MAGNVIPDLCTVTVNFRFAPSRSAAEAEAHVREVFDGFDVTVVDVAPGALPGLSQPAAAAFIAAVGGQPRAKLGWTDVARFSAVGVPAVNYGPGDPSVAHMREEYVDLPRHPRLLRPAAPLAQRLNVEHSCASVRLALGVHRGTESATR